MMTNICQLLVLALVLLGPQAQKPVDSEQIWKDWIIWFRAAPPLEGNPVQAYLAELQKKGISQEDSKRQAAIIMRLQAERPEGVAVHYDTIYSRPVTGQPWVDGFASEPNAFLIEATRGVAPAAALDAAMGQGRNALYLAQAGWKVTGFDISDVGLTAARASAEKKGLRITTIKASYDTFDFGVDKWDLIVMTYAWAPVADPAFVRKIQASLLNSFAVRPPFGSDLNRCKIIGCRDHFCLLGTRRLSSSNQLRTMFNRVTSTGLIS